MSADDLPEMRGADAEIDVSDADRGAAHRLLGPGDFHNVEAEAALLGALMIDNRLIYEISQTLKEGDFSEPLHGRIYRTCVRLVANGKIATPVTLRPIFEHDPDIAQLGGPAYLAHLTGSGAAIIGARDFAAQVIELARMRRLYDAMIAAVRSFQDEGEIAGAVDKLEREIWSATDTYRPIRIRSAADMIGLTEARIERIQDNATAQIGVDSVTLPEIANLVGNLEPTQQTIIAGRPGMGKTTLALSWSWGAAAKGHCGSYLHLEMSGELMALKVATDIAYSTSGAKIPFRKVRKGLLDQAEKRAIAAAREHAAQLPLRFADVGRADITRLEAVIAREVAYWAAQGRKLEFVVVDYIGLVQCADERDPARRVARVSKALLDIAKKYDLHTIPCAQLSRKVEDRAATDRRPMLSDLRDSGDLEQDADNVIFLHRPEVYLVNEKPKPGVKNFEALMTEWDIDMAEWSKKVEIIAGKARLDQTGSRRAWFYGDYSAVRSLSFRAKDDDDGEDLFMAGR